jgi:hypothetical protein
VVPGNGKYGPLAVAVQIPEHFPSQVNVRSVRPGTVEEVARQEHNIDFQPVSHRRQIPERVTHLFPALVGMIAEAAQLCPEVHVRDL